MFVRRCSSGPRPGVWFRTCIVNAVFIEVDHPVPMTPDMLLLLRSAIIPAVCPEILQPREADFARSWMVQPTIPFPPKQTLRTQLLPAIRIGTSSAPSACARRQASEYF